MLRQCSPLHVSRLRRCITHELAVQRPSKSQYVTRHRTALNSARHTNLARGVVSLSTTKAVLTHESRRSQHASPDIVEKGLPTYRPPTTGLLSVLPSALVPYAELSRLEKPAGTAYLLMPCLFSTLMAACIATPLPTVGSIVYIATLFTLGATTMRGAGCTINDLWDRNLDKLVTRTRLRPLARGAVSVPAAITWFCAQSLVGLIVLLQFPVNAVFLAVPSMLLVCTYPLAKRVTQFPQFVLGMAFSWGAFLGFPSLGVPMIDFGVQVSVMEALRTLNSTQANLHITILEPSVLVSAGLLYASCITWTLLYDTIYAFQDIKDDRHAGIKSTAQAFSTKGLTTDLIDRKPKTVLTGLAIAQTSLLAASGYSLDLSPVFYVTSCTGALGTTLLMTRKVNLQDVKNCAWWFKMGCWITGGAIGGGLGLEYAGRASSTVNKWTGFNQ